VPQRPPSASLDFLSSTSTCFILDPRGYRRVCGVGYFPRMRSSGVLLSLFPCQSLHCICVCLWIRLYVQFIHFHPFHATPSTYLHWVSVMGTGREVTRFSLCSNILVQINNRYRLIHAPNINRLEFWVWKGRNYIYILPPWALEGRKWNRSKQTLYFSSYDMNLVR
jgi:hypothetical protein